MPRTASTFRLTTSLIAAHGGAVICLDASAEGRSYRLHASRPETFERIRTDVIGWNGAVVDVAAAALDVTVPCLARVDVRGPIEQCAGYHDECGGWSDGNDAITERLCAALQDEECGAVLLTVDSPGGSPLGLAEGVRRVVEAKAATGKRVIGFVADGMAASAAYWWISGVCDLVYLPPTAQAGSIGARAAHADISGALARDGITVTHFCWPDEGKIAFAPELPLSEIGKARGDRDIALIGEAFGAAVSASRGLPIETIRAMRADLYTGAEAVARGLCDGVATLEETTAYALTVAGGAGDPMENEDDEKGPPGARAEGDGEDDAPKAAKCGKCEGDNPAESKYCNHCGLSLGGMPAEPETEEEDAPESSKRPEAMAAKPAARAAVRAPGAASTFASLAGLPATASQPAILSALSRRVDVFAKASALTGQTSPGEVIGGLDRIAADAAKYDDTKAQLVKVQRKANAQERMDLLGKLEAGNVHTAGELFVPVLDANDKRTGDRKPAPQWSAGPEGRTLTNLRGYTTSKLTNGGPPKRDPFVPDMAAALAAAGAKDGKPTAAQIEAAKKNPTVLGMFNRPNNEKTLDQIATAFCTSGFGGAQ